MFSRILPFCGSLIYRFSNPQVTLQLQSAFFRYPFIRPTIGSYPPPHIGTPVVINEGLRAVKELKDAFPSLKVLADLKIMDAGGYEVMKASEAGADIITVLGVSDDSTIQGAVDEAHKQNKKNMVDMINVKDMSARAQPRPSSISPLQRRRARTMPVLRFSRWAACLNKAFCWSLMQSSWRLWTKKG